uniref:Uncharacterized protein n=1 Tax=Oryza nivara TaxID=4536 RepID=A0A0E0GH80_ORYNI
MPLPTPLGGAEAPKHAKPLTSNEGIGYCLERLYKAAYVHRSPPWTLAKWVGSPQMKQLPCTGSPVAATNIMPSAFRPLPLLPRPWVPPLRPADADDCLVLLRPPRPRTPRPLGAEFSTSAFDTLVLLVCWMIWKERNTRVFQNQSRTAGFLFGAIKDEAAIWKEAGNNAIKEPINVN